MFPYRLCHFKIFIHSSVNIIFKIMLIGIYILLFSTTFLVIIEILGVGLHPHLSKCKKGYMARESLGKPVLNLNQGNSDRL